MGKLVELRNKLKGISKAELHLGIMNIILSEEEFILDLIREQMQAGETPEGGQIGTYQSESYARMKGHSYVDLFLTGDFYYSMYIEDINEDKFRIYADDVKTEELLTKYGDVLDLNEANRKILAARLKPKFGEYFKSLMRVKRGR